MEEEKHLNPETVHPVAQLFEMANGFMKSQAIYVAAKFGIADLLKEGPLGIEELAKQTGAVENALFRLMRALVGIGVFAENNNGGYELTPMSSALLSDMPVSLRPYLLLLGDRSWWNSWGNLHYSIMTDKPAIDHTLGMTYSEYLDTQPDLANTLNDCMSSVSEINNPAIVGSYDFSRFHKIVDVGGGHGSLLIAALRSNTSAMGFLFDLPRVIDAIEPDIISGEKRLEPVAGNFFENVPGGGDLYILKQIIHDWDDERSIQILANCSRAMKQNGRVLLIETVIEPGGGPDVANFFDLHMLVTAEGGKERTKSDYLSLLKTAGLELLEIHNTPSSFSLIEARLLS